MDEDFKAKFKHSETISEKLIQSLQIAKPNIQLLYYDENIFEEKEIKILDDCTDFKSRSGVSWITLESIEQPKILENITDFFNIKSLTLEKISDPNLQGKLEDTGSNINIFLKTSFYDLTLREVLIQRISLVISSNFILLFQDKDESSIFKPVKDNLKNNPEGVRKQKTDFLTYLILDEIVDNYAEVLENLSEKISLIEDELIKKPSSNTLNEIQTLKRELVFLHKSVLSVSEITSKLQKSNSKLISADTKNLFQELFEHCNRVKSNIETYKDIVSDMLEIYLSSLTNKTNEVVRVLTVISTIFMPPTFIVGIYGMNFKYMPELNWGLGYPFVMVFIFAVIFIMLVYFKRKHWF